MSEFGVGDVICPRSGIVSAEDLKVYFYFLVYPFGFSVRLRVVGGGEGQIILQESSKFSSQGGCKLGTTV